MHHETERVREKTHEDVVAELPPGTHHAGSEPGSPSTASDTDSESQASTGHVHLVTFRPGEPADPHNWSSVSPLLPSIACQATDGRTDGRTD